MNGMSRHMVGVDRGPMWLAGLVLVASLGLTSPEPARAQGVAFAGLPVKDQPCDTDIVGWLGIALVDCGGACQLTMDDKGANLEWLFSVEPRIVEITPASSAARALRAGDRIVAIDGFLITTREGGRRFANIEPGGTVVIRYRREGRVADAALRAGSRCGPAVEGVPAFPALLSVSAPSASASKEGEQWAGPGMLIQYRNTPDGRRTTITLPGSDSAERPTTTRFPKGRLGLSFACGPCSNSYDDGQEMWTFSNPIEVTRIEADGPSDRAGMRLGDRITHINGARITSKRGGTEFSTIRPGQATQFTVIGRDGHKRTVTVVPS